MEMNFDGNVQLTEIQLGGETYHVVPEARQLYEEILAAGPLPGKEDIDLTINGDWHLHTAAENAILLLYAIDKEAEATRFLKANYVDLNMMYLLQSPLFLPPLQDYSFYKALYSIQKIDADTYATLQMLSGELWDTHFFEMWFLENVETPSQWLEKLTAYALNEQTVIYPVNATQYLWTKCQAIEGEDTVAVTSLYRAILMGVIKCTADQINELVIDTRVNSLKESVVFKSLIGSMYLNILESGEEDYNLIRVIEGYLSVGINLEYLTLTPSQFFEVVKWNKTTQLIGNEVLVKSIVNNQKLVYYIEILKNYVNLTDFQKYLNINHMRFIQYYKSLGLDLSDFIHCDYMFDENQVVAFNKSTSEVWLKTPVEGRYAISVDDYKELPIAKTAMMLKGEIDVLCEGSVDAHNIFNFIKNIEEHLYKTALSVDAEVVGVDI
jgi:hypothetical protein